MRVWGAYLGIFMLPLAFGTAPCAAQSTASPQAEGAERSSHPVGLSMIYTGDANADISGGEQTGTAYLHRIGLIGDIDLQSALGWRGARAHISVHSIVGTGLSMHRVGNVLTVSGIEAEPALRLFNLWIEQRLGDRTTLRVGQFNADQNFAISSTASLFVNSSFGWPGSFATDLPSGGPAYPLAAPGASLSMVVTKRTVMRLAVFAGDAAGPGDGDPQRRDLHGLNGLRFQGAPFLIGEVQRSAVGDDPAWSVTLGGWAHFDRFDDVRRDANGASLASRGTTGVPKRHPGNFAVYAMADTRLWRANGHVLHGFARVSVSPGDRNAIDLYGDAGLALTGTLRSRPDDILGLALAVARLSPELRGRRLDSCAMAALSCRTPTAEAVIEASYQLHFSDRVHLQPNVQLVLHPAGALVSDPGTPGRVPGTAVVLGMRTSFRL